MILKRCTLITSLAVVMPMLMVPLVAQASVFGSLGNFDVVNDTGSEAYGFEIEIEDPLFDHTKVVSIFGLNRSFGTVAGGNPLAVVRYGSVHVIDVKDAFNNPLGVRVRYGGVVGSPVFTPSGSYGIPSDSCWPGVTAWSTAAPCDHFGITTLGSPAATKYSWLVKDGSGNLVPMQAGIPAVNFAPQQPVQGQPLAVQVQIRAVAPPLPPAIPEAPEFVARWGEPYWVKMTKTSMKIGENIDLGDLLRGERGNPDLGLETETEIEWSVLQNAPAIRDREIDGPGANEVKEKHDELGAQDKAIIRRYEFYKYTGPVDIDGSGEVVCNDACENDPYGLVAALNQVDGHLGISYVGPYVGQQMAGFNAVQAVPEPETYAMMLAGLGLIAAIARHRKSRR